MKTKSPLLKIGLSLVTGLLSLVLLMTILATVGSAEAQGKEGQNRPMWPAAYAVPSANQQQTALPAWFAPGNRQPASPNAPLAGGPIITVSKSVSDEPLVGGQVSYGINVENIAPDYDDDRGFNLTISDTLPAGLAFASSSLAPSVVTENPDGSTFLQWINIKNLEAAESFQLTINADILPTIAVGVSFTNVVTAAVNTVPDNSGSWIMDTASVVATAQAIDIEKTAEQSTGVSQATGAGGYPTATGRIAGPDWPYIYRLTVKNNNITGTTNVIVTDTLPPGAAFLGGTWYVDGTPVSPTANLRPDGFLDLSYNLGTLSTANYATPVVITFPVAIPYRFRTGTDPISGTGPYHGAIIPDDHPITNTYEATGLYNGNPTADGTTSTPQDDPPDEVNAAYLTVEKGVTPGTVRHGDTVTYTINYYVSEYYTFTDVILTDVLTDGLTYGGKVSGPGPDPTVSTNTPITGATTLTFTIPPANTTPGNWGTVVFTATVDTHYERFNITPVPPIVSGDSLVNRVIVSGDYTDTITAGRNGDSADGDSASVSTIFPSLRKMVKDPNTGQFVSGPVTATIGDSLTFSLTFTVPQNIAVRNIVVDDFLPRGMSYVTGTASYSVVPTGVFTDSAAITPVHPLPECISDPTPTNPSTKTLSGLEDLEWNLCSAEQQVVWRVSLDAIVEDVPVVADGILVANFGNTSGLNTFGQSYSLRDSNEVNYVEPKLVLIKSASQQSNLEPGDTVTYTISVRNDGHGPAYNVGLTDTIPAYIKVATAPAGSGSPQAVTYTVWSGDPENGKGGVLTWTEIISIPAGGTQTYTYTAVISDGVGARRDLENIASVEYNSRSDDQGRQTDWTSDPADDNTDDETVCIRNLSVSKSAAPDPVTIGDIFTQTLRVTVPAGTQVFKRSGSSVIVRDTQSTNGIQFLTTTVTLADDSSNPPGPASFASPSTTLVDTSGGSYVDFNLNDIDNSGQTTDYVFTLTIQALVTGLDDDGTSWVFFVPTVNDQTNDIFQVRFNDGTANRTRSSDRVYINIDQPLLDLEKTVTPVTADGDDTVTYTLTVENVGWSVAYDVVLTDAIPANVKVPATGGSGSPVNSTFTADAGAQAGTGGFITWGTVPSITNGNTQTYIYTATVSGTVPAGSVLVNTADVDWSTQSGATSDERVFDDNSEEAAYTEDTDSATLNIDVPQLDKTIFATSLDATGKSQHTAGIDDLAIGEVVTFHIVITFPEGTTPAILTDTMLNFATDDEVLRVLSSEVLAFGSNVSATGDNPGASGTHTDLYFSDGINDTVEFDFGTVTNTPDGVVDGGDCITVEVVARVEDVPENTDGDLLTSPATLDYDTGTLSDAVDVEIVEPDIAIDKSVASSTGSTSDLDGTALLTYTIRLTNTGTSPAYDVVITTAVESGISVTALYGGDSHSVPVQGPGILTWTVSVMSRTLPGANNPLVLTYTARISGAVASAPGETIQLTNTVSATYSSLPGDLPPDQERDYGPITAMATVSTSNANVKKSVAPTSSSTNNLRIGDIVTYTIVDEVPPGLVLYWPYHYDQLPVGFRYVTGTFTVVGTNHLPFAGSGLTATLTSPFASGTYPNQDRGVLGLSATTNPTVGPQYNNADRQNIEWWFQTLNNAGFNTTGLVTITFQAQIVGEDLDGDRVWWPDQLGSESESPRVYLLWNTEDTGAYTYTVPVNDDYASATSHVGQPNLTIDKDSDPPPGSLIGKGDLITYTLTITNDGHAPAYDIVVSDTLPPPDLTTYITSTIGSATPSTIAFTHEPPVGATDVITWRVNDLWGSDLGGGTAVITVVVQVTDTIGADVRLTNIAAIPYYDSQPGDGPGPHTPDEREYTGNFDSVWLQTIRPYGKKFDTITATIGDKIVFRVEGPWITATIYNVVATDTVDSRLLVEGCRAIGDGALPIECGRIGQVVTGTWGSIPPLSGEKSTLFITTTLQDQISATAGVIITNTADYRWTDNPDPASQEYLFSINVVTVTVAEPKITLDKSVQVPRNPVGAGDIVTYTIVLTNEGQSTPWVAYDVVVTDTLPPGVTFVETKEIVVTDPTTATKTYHDIRGSSTMTWYVSQLNVDGRAYITFTAQVSAAIGARLTLTNAVKEGHYDTQPGDALVERTYNMPTDTAPIQTGEPELDLTKTAWPTTVIAGMPLTYTLTVTNVGIVSATEVFITDVIPVNTIFVTASTPLTGPVPNNDPGSIITWSLGILDIGIPRTVTMVVHVPSSVPTGTIITNTAWVTCAEGISDTDTITTLVNTLADLAVLKSDDPDPVPSGGILAYTLNYVNNGPSYARNVYITDTLPLSVTYGGVVSVTPPLFGPTLTVGPPDQLTWYTPTLPDGASGSIVFTITVLVTTTDPFSNTVVITSTTPDPITGNNTAIEWTAKPLPVGGATMPFVATTLVTQVGLAALTGLLLAGGMVVVGRRRRR